MFKYCEKNNSSHSTLEKFLQEYGLDTKEGVILLCLAETLLRVPDTRTQDELIKDKLQEANWIQHLGTSYSSFVNASSWGLLFSGKCIQLGENTHNIFGKLISKLGEPVIRNAIKSAMLIISSQFIIGETITKAIQKGKQSEKQNYLLSYDMLGERARTYETADQYFEFLYGFHHYYW